MRTSKLFQDYTYLDLDPLSKRKYCHLLHVLAEKSIKDKSRDTRNSPGRQICRHHLSVLNADNSHWYKYIFILKTLTTCAVRYMEECKLIQTTLFLSLHEKSYFFLKPLWIVCTPSGFNILTYIPFSSFKALPQLNISKYLQVALTGFTLPKYFFTVQSASPNSSSYMIKHGLVGICN